MEYKYYVNLFRSAQRSRQSPGLEQGQKVRNVVLMDDEAVFLTGETALGVGELHAVGKEDRVFRTESRLHLCPEGLLRELGGVQKGREEFLRRACKQILQRQLCPCFPVKGRAQAVVELIRCREIEI